MKNLLVYISPEKVFNEENFSYIEIQIENSLKYWRSSDIILATNFPHKYMGVEALVVPDNLHSDISRCVVKVNVITYLLEKGVLDELTWFHDTEAWQIAPFDIELKKDLGLTDYGWSQKWNGGSMFFKPESVNIFQMWRDAIKQYMIDDERTLMKLTEKNVGNINDRIERLNITYNIGRRRINENVEKADKPLKVLHFHPYRENLLNKFDYLLPNDLWRLIHEKDYRFRK